MKFRTQVIVVPSDRPITQWIIYSSKLGIFRSKIQKTMSVPTSEIAFPQPLPPFLRPPSIGEVRRKAPQSLAGPFPLLAQDGQSVLSVRAGKEGQVLAKPWYMLEMKRLDEVSAPPPASAAEDERSERGAEESDKQKDPLFLGDPTKVPLFYFDGPFIRMACPKGLHANNLEVRASMRTTPGVSEGPPCEQPRRPQKKAKKRRKKG